MGYLKRSGFPVLRIEPIGGIMDTWRVNAAVKISLEPLRRPSDRLREDLARLTESMTTEEYNCYMERTN